MKLQLTISMLVTDGRPTLERCLHSLAPILQGIPSELIIVFTGKEQATLDTIRKYTDHIIPFTWCDDFSKARNVGLKEAKGEWFLYLDDDEWFENVAGILQFFRSGEYLLYDGACYIQRNYQNLFGNDYMDFQVLRLHKIFPELCFSGSIHEFLNYPRTATKQLTDFVHHYGYVGKKNKEYRSERNIPPLLEELKEYSKGPRAVKNYMQLAQEYGSIKEWEKAEECCRKGIAISHMGTELYSVHYSLLIRCPAYAIEGKGFSYAKKTAEEMLMDEWCDELPTAYLYYLLTILCRNLKEADAGLAYAREFQKMLEYLRKNPEVAQIQSFATLNLMRIENSSSVVYSDSAYFAMQRNDENALQEVLDWIPWEDEEMAGRCCLALEAWKKEFPEMEQPFLLYFAEKESENPYVLFQKCLYLKSSGDLEKLKEIYEKFEIQKEGHYRFLNGKLLALALEHALDLSKFENIVLAEWEAYAQEIISHMDVSMLDSEMEKIRDALGKYQFPMLVFEKENLEKQLLQGGLEGEELIICLREYCSVSLSYYRALYREELFCGECRELPAKCGFCIFISKALQALEEKRWENCFAAFRKALNCYPVMVRLIDSLCKYIEHCQSLPSVNPEMLALAEGIRGQIEFLMDQGEYRTAYGILEQVLTLLPGDWELLKLKQRVLREG